MIHPHTLACGLILLLRARLAAALLTCMASAPFVWLLRDGLGPDMVESVVMQAIHKLVVAWGVPALALSGLMVGLTVADRQLARRERQLRHEVRT